jgi:hypothetical protein
MLNVPKTVRFRFIFGLAVWRVLLVTKRTLFDSSKWGRILYFKIRSTAPTTMQAFSCRHQIFDGTNRNAEHPVTILKNLLK